MMALFAGFTIFVAISALMYGIMNTRVAARAYVDRRLARARGLEVAASAAAVDVPLRANRFSRAGGGLARMLANLQTARRLSDLLERAGWPLSVTEFGGTAGIAARCAAAVPAAAASRCAAAQSLQQTARRGADADRQRVALWRGPAPGDQPDRRPACFTHLRRTAPHIARYSDGRRS